MYRAEVLGKLPVIQHFLFGSILAYEGPVFPLPLGNQVDEHHSHDPSEAHAGWHDACGIPVPSIFAAAAEAQKREAGVRLAGTRPVPFD